MSLVHIVVQYNIDFVYKLDNLSEWTKAVRLCIQKCIYNLIRTILHGFLTYLRNHAEVVDALSSVYNKYVVLSSDKTS